MKERGKAVEVYRYNRNVCTDFNYSSSSEMPCKKHPSSSSVGICAYCLKDRLVKLVCSDCGEKRLSSCSCSDYICSSYRNSSCTADVGGVGRISFLIENEKTDQKPKKRDKAEEIILLRRSSSSCVEVKRYKGFWKIKRLFRKKKEKGYQKNGEFDDKSDAWVSDIMGVSRSRSLCSFRGGGFNDTDEGSDYRFSSAKISDFTGGILFDYDRQCGGFSEGETRKSGFRGASEESEPRKSGFRVMFNEAEPRKSGCRGISDTENSMDLKGLKKVGPLELDRAYSVPNRSVFPVKESDFSAMDDSAFIDLNLDLSSESKSEPHPVIGTGSLKGETYFCNGGSCRITVNDGGIKRGTNSYKVWKWFSRHYSGRKSSSKKDEISIFKS
ncbi:hypothetical protein ACH5RR_036052 [Cinchona calisaya]|uniref:Uncharacterized protein n=1 Tax=Cinchona calisaya TaxID=153742 RepID=A0ABD2Y7L4_9GENT